VPSLTAFVLLLQVRLPEDTGERPNRASVEFSAVRQTWFPDFHGSFRMDGGTTRGTSLRLVDDLHMPDHAIIPIYGGGDISVTVRQTFSEKNRLLFSAEYWNHSWTGRTTLSSPERLGNASFPEGEYVESHFHMTFLTLDAFVVHEEKPFRIGATIPIHHISARTRVDSLVESGRETIRDVCWGGGVFGDVRPIPYVFAGVTARALTSFANAGGVFGLDLRGYAGLEWGPFRVEGGYRSMTYDLALREKSLRYALDGPYASLSLILRF